MLVCPDGRKPWVELLFADHVWSFAPHHVGTLLERSGWCVQRVLEAPEALGPFMMIAAQRAAAEPSPSPAGSCAAMLGREKRDYLLQWRALDATIVSRSRGGHVICFGIGEAAGLLRAYAPNIWSRVAACAADMPEHQRFGDRSVHRSEDIPAHAEMLLGVRPAAQARLVARFQNRHHVIRWDDVIRA